MRTTADRAVRALPGPAATAVIRTVSRSVAAWLDRNAAGDPGCGGNKARAAATIGSVVSRIRLGRSEQRQMRADCGEHRRGHAEHPAELVDASRAARRGGRNRARRRGYSASERFRRLGKLAEPTHSLIAAARRLVLPGVAAGNAQQRLEERRRGRARIDPRGLVVNPHHDPAVADHELARDPVERPALFRPRIEQVEDGVEDRAVGGGLGRRISHQIAGDADLGSPARRQM